METKGIDFSDLSNTDKVTDKSASKVVIKSVTRQFHNISVPFRLENMRSA